MAHKGRYIKTVNRILNTAPCTNKKDVAANKKKLLQIKKTAAASKQVAANKKVTANKKNVAASKQVATNEKKLLQIKECCVVPDLHTGAQSYSFLGGRHDSHKKCWRPLLITVSMIKPIPKTGICT